MSYSACSVSSFGVGWRFLTDSLSCSAKIHLLMLLSMLQLQEMLDEQGAKADAVAAVAPLRDLAQSSATSEEQDEGAQAFKDERAPQAAAHAQQRAAQNREAQQRDLAQRTGDVLYPSVGALLQLSAYCEIELSGCICLWACLLLREAWESHCLVITGPEEPEAAQPGDSSWNSKPAEF